MTTEKKLDWTLFTLVVTVSFLLGVLSGVVDDDWRNGHADSSPCAGAPYRGHRHPPEEGRNDAG